MSNSNKKELHNPRDVLTCKRCRHVFCNKKSVKRHQSTKGEDCVGFLYACKRCFKPFKDIKTLYKHQLSEEDCPVIVFENNIKPSDRISIMFAIGEEGFKEIITKTLTPQPYDLNNPEETKLNFDLIILLFNSLSTHEFVNLIKIIVHELPDLKFHLMAALKKYIDQAPDDKAEKIKEFFKYTRSASFY